MRLILLLLLFYFYCNCRCLVLKRFGKEGHSEGWLREGKGQRGGLVVDVCQVFVHWQHCIGAYNVLWQVRALSLLFWLMRVKCTQSHFEFFARLSTSGQNLSQFG